MEFEGVVESFERNWEFWLYNYYTIYSLKAGLGI